MMPGGPVLGDAILRLVPTARYLLKNEDLGELEWLSEDVERPSDEEILAQFEALKIEYSDHEYRRQRASAYPSIGDQLDALFHAGVFPDEMAARIQAVKDAFPKGGE
jgi:hypothetical protein